jgi:hypothetical protein
MEWMRREAERGAIDASMRRRAVVVVIVANNGKTMTYKYTNQVLASGFPLAVFQIWYELKVVQIIFTDSIQYLASPW